MITLEKLCLQTGKGDSNNSLNFVHKRIEELKFNFHTESLNDIRLPNRTGPTTMVLSWPSRSLRLLVFCGFFLVLLKYVFEKALIVLLWNFYCTRSRCGLLVFNIWVLMLSWYYKYFLSGPVPCRKILYLLKIGLPKQQDLSKFTSFNGKTC